VTGTLQGSVIEVDTVALHRPAALSVRVTIFGRRSGQLFSH